MRKSQAIILDGHKKNPNLKKYYFGTFANPEEPSYAPKHYILYKRSTFRMASDT